MEILVLLAFGFVALTIWQIKWLYEVTPTNPKMNKTPEQLRNETYATKARVVISTALFLIFAPATLVLLELEEDFLAMMSGFGFFICFAFTIGSTMTTFLYIVFDKKGRYAFGKNFSNGSEPYVGNVPFGSKFIIREVITDGSDTN